MTYPQSPRDLRGYTDVPTKLINTVFDSTSYIYNNVTFSTPSSSSTISGITKQIVGAAQQSGAGTDKNMNTNANRTWPPVHCPTHMANRRDPDTSIDPNMNYAESPKRYINKTSYPPFWISLHKQVFDPMRWASIMVGGEYYETGVTRQFSTILANQSRGLVIDIGMNIGWFSLLARAYGHDVVAFEPNPKMHYRMCESIQLNGWDTDSGNVNTDARTVQMFPYGLGVEIGTFNLTTGRNPGGSSFYEEKLAKRHRKVMPVRVTTLDTVALQEGWIPARDPDPTSPVMHIHLMKIDVEGFEPFVLQGGQKLLNSGRISNIILENSNADETLVIDMFVRLYQAGYRCKLISDVNGKKSKTGEPSALNNEIENYIAAKAKASPAGGETVKVEESDWVMKWLVKHTLNLWWSIEV